MPFDAPDFDMLGLPRPVGANFDMGAYDVQGWGLRLEPAGQQKPSDLLSIRIPFPVSTTIEYTVPGSCQVTVCIFNGLGQLVGIPVNEWQKAGSYKVTWNAGSLEPGLFLVKLRAGNETDEVILVKY